LTEGMAISAERKINTIYSIETASPEETEKAGSDLAKNLKPGDIVGLIGELGAGKTCFTAGIARAFDAKVSVNSPTFVLIREYPGNTDIYHFDLYRLNSIAELGQIGYRDYFYGKGISVVEWAEKALDILPEDAWIIRITAGKGNKRKMEIGILIK
jgi:tRNA threonylcarbamoyladenosine biosynthesis protein TsaE